jgi:hypothetical protein
MSTKAAVKNTFIHINESDEELLPMRRFKSIPSDVGHAAVVFPHSPESTESGPAETVIADDMAVRSKLDAKAARWQSSAQRADALMSQAELLMQVVKAGLESSGKVLTVELLGKSYGMHVALAWIRPEDLLHVDSLLTQAKDTLLCASAAAEDVCMLGSSTAPFTQRPHGFAVVLAENPADMPNACWHMYNKGCCRRGRSCRWKHPQHTVELSVAFAVSAGV